MNLGYPAIGTLFRRFGLLLLGIGVVIVLSGALLLLGGADPILALGVMYNGAFGSWAGFGETLLRFSPLALVALGLIPSLRIGLFNIGAPGQIAAGGLASALINLNLPNSSVLHSSHARVSERRGGRRAVRAHPSNPAGAVVCQRDSSRH